MNTTRRLVLSPRAAADLKEVADYIARDNPVRVATFIAELEAKCRAVAEAPEVYAAHTDLAPGPRMAVHGRYLALYQDLQTRGQNVITEGGTAEGLNYATKHL